MLLSKCLISFYVGYVAQKGFISTLIVLTASDPATFP